MNQQGTSFESGSRATHVQTSPPPFLHAFRAIPVLGVAETPDFIALETLAVEVPENLVLILGTGAAKIDKQLHNRCAMVKQYHYGKGLRFRRFELSLIMGRIAFGLL